MKTKLSIIIPVFNLKDERLRNFLCIIKKLVRTEIPTCISLQARNQEEVETISQLLEVFDPLRNINLFYEIIDDDKIHKSTLINKVSEILDTDYIWVLDADVFLDYEQIYDTVRDQDVIKPFKNIFRLSEEQTKEFIKNSKIKLPKGSVETTTDIFGPLTFIIKKSIFDKENRMNQNFKGWGWEDLEFASRIMERYQVEEFNICGLHLHHPRNTVNEVENRKIFNEESEGTILHSMTSIQDNEKIVCDDKGNLSRQNTDITIPLHIQHQSEYIHTNIEKVDGKIDLSDVSVVIPVRVDSKDRIKNLKIVLNYFNDFFKNFEMIVVEHDKEIKLKELVENFGFKHIGRITEGSFHKTYNFNLGISISYGRFIAAYDCDSIFNPLAIKFAFDRLKSGETNFIFPYNRYMIQIKKHLLQNIDSIDESFLKLLPLVKTGVLEDTTDFEVLYGSHDYECTGGALFFRKESFFLNGGYNPNIISYGCEDNEIELRIKKLGNRLERLENFNCYHLEHGRSIDSHYNNFFPSNEKEFSQIKDMSGDEIREYVHNGFKHTLFDTMKSLSIVNNKNEYIIKIEEINNKVDLSDVDIIIPTFIDFQDRLNNLNAVLNLIEKFYCNYNIILIELESQKAKYLYHKVGIQYFNYDETFNKTRAINLAIDKCTRPIVSVWDVDALIPTTGVEEAVEAVRSGSYKISYPYNGWFLDADGEVRNNLVRDLEFDLPLFTDDSNDYEIPGLEVRYSTRYRFKGGGNNGGCVFFDRETLKQLGNYNENFYQWGYEDDEIEQRFEIMGYQRFNSQKANCYHMVHKRVDSATIYGDEFFKINHREFQRVTSMSQEVLGEYIKNDFLFKYDHLTLVASSEEELESYSNYDLINQIIVTQDSGIKAKETSKILLTNDLSISKNHLLFFPNGNLYSQKQVRDILKLFNTKRRVAVVDSNKLVATRKDFWDVVRVKGYDFLNEFQIPSDEKEVLCSILYTTYAGETRSSEEYLNRFKDWKTDDYQLIAVVHDETPKHRVLLEYYKSIGVIDKLIYAVPNHGHVKGLSLAVSQADSEFIIIANNDIRISKEIIDYCLKQLEKDEVGVVGWHYNDYPNHEGTIWNGDSLNYSQRDTKIKELLPEEIEQIETASWYTGKLFKAIGHKRLLLCNGSFMATKKFLWNKLGGFNPEKFEHYFSDDYYCYGVLDQGYDVVNLPRDYRCSQCPEVFESLSDLEFKNKKNPFKGVDDYSTSWGSADKDVFVKLVKCFKSPKISLIGSPFKLLEGLDYSSKTKIVSPIDILVITEPISDHRVAKNLVKSGGWVFCLSKFADSEYDTMDRYSIYSNIKRISYKSKVYNIESQNDKPEVSRKRNKITNKTKFVCLTQPRVGFTPMKILFDKHSDIHLDQAIFGNDYMSNIAMGVGSNKKKDPVGFVDSYFSLMSVETNKNILGFRFKTWDEPIDFVSKNLVRMDDIKKIIITRENLLMGLVDCAFAHQTNIWQAVEEVDSFPQIKIDLEWARGWLVECKNVVNNWKDSLELNNKEFINVTYEEIFYGRKRGLNKIYDYLDTKKLKLPFNLKPTINEKAYKSIINLKELNDKFGKEFGYIE